MTEKRPAAGHIHRIHLNSPVDPLARETHRTHTGSPGLAAGSDPRASAHMMSMDIYAESAVQNTDVLPYGDATFQIVDEAMGGVIAYCHKDNAGRIVDALIAAR